MSNPAQLKQSMRYQKWFEEVQAYKARPEGMSSAAWSEANGIKPATFYCRLRKIQQLYVDSLEQTSIVPVKSVEPPAVAEPTFVELASAPSSKTVSTSSGVATILCGSARIEIVNGTDGLPFTIYQQMGHITLFGTFIFLLS